MLPALLSLDTGQDGCSSQENQQDRHLTHLGTFSLSGGAEFHSNLCLLPLAWGMPRGLFHFNPHPFPDLLLLCYRSQVLNRRVCKQGTLRRFVEKKMLCLSFQWRNRENCEKRKLTVLLPKLCSYSLNWNFTSWPGKIFCYLLLVAYVLFKRRERMWRTLESMCAVHKLICDLPSKTTTTLPLNTGIPVTSVRKNRKHTLSPRNTAEATPK